MSNNQSFYSIADFFFYRFTSLRERKRSLQEEKSNVSSRRIEKTNDFTAGILAYSSPGMRSRFLSLPLSFFYVCRHIQRAIHEFIAFFKIYVCFSEKQLAMQVSAKRNASWSIGFACLISHWITWRGGRTDSCQTVGRTEVT